MAKDICELKDASGIRLVVTDLDGTLLDERKEISPRALRAIGALRRCGILFSICTGREYAMLEHYARILRPTAPMVCNNGGEVIRYPDGKVIERTLLPPVSALRFLEFCMQRGIDFCATTPSGAFFPRQSGMTDFYEEYQRRSATEGLQGFPVFRIEGLHQLEKLPLNKIILRTDLSVTEEAVAFLQRELPEFDTTMSSEWILEILPHQMNKSVGLRHLCRWLEISPEQCCAVGDYDNDIEMLSLAGISVAMGNAIDAVKGTAGYLTRSNEEDGVALVLEQIADLRGG